MRVGLLPRALNTGKGRFAEGTWRIEDASHDDATARNAPRFCYRWTRGSNVKRVDIRTDDDIQVLTGQRAIAVHSMDGDCSARSRIPTVSPPGSFHASPTWAMIVWQRALAADRQSNASWLPDPSIPARQRAIRTLARLIARSLACSSSSTAAILS